MVAAQAWERSDAHVLLYRPAADHVEGWLTAGGWSSLLWVVAAERGQDLRAHVRWEGRRWHDVRKAECCRAGWEVRHRRAKNKRIAYTSTMLRPRIGVRCRDTMRPYVSDTVGRLAGAQGTVEGFIMVGVYRRRHAEMLPSL